MGGQKQLFDYGTAFSAKKWFSLDICGILGISVSYSIHIFAFLVQYIKIVGTSTNSTATPLFFYCLYLPFSVLAVISLYQASTTNPGAVPLGARPFVRVRRSGAVIGRARAMRRCAKCANNYKPDRAHHDSVTGRCIVKFDHFCPWVNNAVGALNHKFFCLFLWYTAATCVCSVTLLVLRLLGCASAATDLLGEALDSSQGSSAIDLHPSNKHAIEGGGGSARRFLSGTALSNNGHCINLTKDSAVIALAVASLVFFLFTVIMAIDQWEAIKTGQGKIARMKQSVGQAGTQYNVVTSEFNEMFGGTSPNPAWHWFIPIPVRFPGAMQQVVLGYDYDPSYDAVAVDDDDMETAAAAAASTADIELGNMAQPTSNNDPDGLMTNSANSSSSGDAPRRRTPSSGTVGIV